ncbi:MAG: hypothetical protein HY303_07010 [Candidatus Wallbacteria bacterium]|nr:hypothetical protein [Candidatus Wallbacteria bacterium]
MRRIKNKALTMLVVFVASLIAPVIVEAQDYEVDLSDDSANMISGVTERLTTKDSLEGQWSKAQQRHDEIQRELSALESAQNQPGRDDGWYQSAAERVRALKDDLTQNDTIVSRTRERLAKVYSQLERDRYAVSNSKDPQVRQELGTLIGVSGSTLAAPIWNRPTVASVRGSMGQAVNEAHLATVNARIPRYQSWAESAGNRVAANEAALGAIKPGVWVPQSNGGNGVGEIILRRHDVLPDGSTGGYTAGAKAVKTGIPAKIQAADGSLHDNTEGMVGANDLASLQNTRTALTNNIEKLRYEASRATNAKIKETLESRANALEGKKGELEKNITEYNSNNPSLGQQAKTLGVNAAKWAAMGAGVTVASNAIIQMAHNGWDPSKIDWGQATAQLKDPHFWGGTAGSFVGSYAGSLIASALPGGAFVKTLFAVGGAAIGWQAGSGQLGNTDWVALGAGTLGSTVGMLIGTALGGPIGAFIGGIVGQLAADFILSKIREAVIKEVPAEPYGGPGDKTAYGDSRPPVDWNSSSGSQGGDSSGYQGSSPANTGYQGGYSGGASGNASDLAQQRAQVYQEMMELQAQMKSDPQAFQQWRQKQQQYDALTRQLHSMQSGSDIRSSGK